MIPIEFSIAVALWVGMATLGILSFWFFSTREQTVSFPGGRRQEIWQCRICIGLYADEIDGELSVCPRCGSYNRKEENGE